MAAFGAGTLLRYFKRDREDEERKDEGNANTGDSQPTRVKKAVYKKPKGKMFCQYCVNFQTVNTKIRLSAKEAINIFL